MLPGRRLLPQRAASSFVTAAIVVTTFGVHDVPPPRAARDLHVQIFDCGYGEIRDVSGFSSGFDKGV